MKNKVII